MRTLKTLMLAALAAVFFGLSAQAQTRSTHPEMEFVNKLSSDIWWCRLKESSARNLRPYSSQEADKNVREMIECARKVREAAAVEYKNIAGKKRSKDVQAALKKAYAKWLSYLESLDPFGPENTYEEGEFNDARNELSVELATQ